jgi:hypothetical protein
MTSIIVVIVQNKKIQFAMNPEHYRAYPFCHSHGITFSFTAHDFLMTETNDNSITNIFHYSKENPGIIVLIMISSKKLIEYESQTRTRAFLTH